MVKTLKEFISVDEASKTDMKMIMKSPAKTERNTTAPTEFYSKRYGSFKINKSDVYDIKFRKVDKDGNKYYLYITDDGKYGYTPNNSGALIGVIQDRKKEGPVKRIKFDSITVKGSKINNPDNEFMVTSGPINIVHYVGS